MINFQKLHILFSFFGENWIILCQHSFLVDPFAGIAGWSVKSSLMYLSQAMRSTLGALKPIFISIGHRISLTTAVKIVQRTCKHRVPEPIRQVIFTYPLLTATGMACVTVIIPQSMWILISSDFDGSCSREALIWHETSLQFTEVLRTPIHVSCCCFSLVCIENSGSC